MIYMIKTVLYFPHLLNAPCQCEFVKLKPSLNLSSFPCNSSMSEGGGGTQIDKSNKNKHYGLYSITLEEREK